MCPSCRMKVALLLTSDDLAPCRREPIRPTRSRNHSRDRGRYWNQELLRVTGKTPRPSNSNRFQISRKLVNAALDVVIVDGSHNN